MGVRLLGFALSLGLAGCYGGLAVGPDRGSPDGGADGSGTGVQAFAGGEIELPGEGASASGSRSARPAFTRTPTPKTTWAVLELRVVDVVVEV